MTEPVPVRPEHAAALTIYDRDPELEGAVGERELPEWDH